MALMEGVYLDINACTKLCYFIKVLENDYIYKSHPRIMDLLSYLEMSKHYKSSKNRIFSDIMNQLKV